MPDAQSQRRIATARRVLEQIHLHPSSAHPCPYLPDRLARDVAFRTHTLPAGLYHSLMDLNFRRSGLVIYRPACESCQQCQAIRVPADRFRPNRSQRRCWMRNRDVTVALAPAIATREKHELYVRYLSERHNRQMDESWESFSEFLYASPVATLDVVYRRAGRLVGVGVIDLDGEAISTVYCYYDPADPGALGTFNILWTVEYARRVGIPWVYLGYTIADCPKMNYKLLFQPCEVLGEDGAWRATR